MNQQLEWIDIVNPNLYVKAHRLRACISGKFIILINHPVEFALYYENKYVREYHTLELAKSKANLINDLERLKNYELIDRALKEY